MQPMVWRVHKHRVVGGSPCPAGWPTSSVSVSESNRVGLQQAFAVDFFLKIYE